MRDFAEIPPQKPGLLHRWDRLANRFLANPKWQQRAAHWPILRRFANRDGKEIFDVMMGFIQSQTLMALVRMGVFERLQSGPMSLDDLSHWAKTPPERMQVLIRSGVALGLLSLRKNTVRLSRKGAVFAGVQGLTELVDHHDILYRDLADPVAFFQGRTKPELARFWPYVHQGIDDLSPHDIDRYSKLMTRTLDLVAADTLASVEIRNAKSWLDVGGGSGAFMAHVLNQFPTLRGGVFDLPMHQPDQNFIRHTGSFKTDPLPQGYDIISLIRVLYDHDDATIQNLLGKIYTSLPKGGQIIVSEPNLGEPHPQKAGDVYFAIYTMAMETGKTRSREQIFEIMKQIGFCNIQMPRAKRPFVTSLITATKK